MIMRGERFTRTDQAKSWMQCPLISTLISFLAQILNFKHRLRIFIWLAQLEKTTKIIQRCSNKTNPSRHRHLPPNPSGPRPSGHPPPGSPQPALDDAPALPGAEAPAVQTETSAEALFSAGDSYIAQCCSSPPTDIASRGCWGCNRKVSAHSIPRGLCFLAIPSYEHGSLLGLDRCRLARRGVRPGTAPDGLRSLCRWALHGKSVEGNWRGADAVS